MRSLRLLILSEAIVNNIGPSCMSNLMQRKDITYNIRNDAVVIIPKCAHVVWYAFI